MGAIAVRKARRSDAATIGALHVASWLETYAGLIPDALLAGLSVEARTAMWNSVLGSPVQFGCVGVFVAEDAGRAVGFGSCGEQRESALVEAGFGGEFGALYVLRSHQRRGVGRSIIVSMSQALTAAGHNAAALWVLSGNQLARHFYGRLGGIIVAERTEPQPPNLVETAYGWRDLRLLVG